MDSKLAYFPYALNFKKPSGTSRGTLFHKDTYIIGIKEQSEAELLFCGECALFKGLSADDRPNYELKLQEVCQKVDPTSINIEETWESLREFPSIQFGLEQVYQSRLLNENRDTNSPLLFPSEFIQGGIGIPINGLIWMGKISFMKSQIKEKLNQNFRCIKLKIGVNWKEEKEILHQLRKEFSAQDLELRVDANGAFNLSQAQIVLEELAELEIHSIEQPIKAGQIQEMAHLCTTTPTPIALDEELIGVFQRVDKEKLLQNIQPQYIILKPSLVGGWRGSQEWIEIAEKNKTGWWVTSALESNIGLNAIAQWTFTLNNPLPQGLGTGGLFTNNFNTRLKVIGDKLFFA